MAWTRCRYRGHKVWVLVDEDGQPVTDDRGLAQMRYRPEDERTYSVRPVELRALDERGPVDAPVDVWAHVERTDDGVARVGAVLCWKGRRREIRCQLGLTTGPGAALAEGVTAVLDAIRRSDLPVNIRVQSAQALERVLAGRGRGTASPAARRLRAAAARLACVAVQGPDGSPEAARAAELAHAAPEV